MKRIFKFASMPPLGALCLLVFGLAPVALADSIPSGWTCSEAITCGTLGADGVVTLSPTGNSAYEYITTSNSSATAVLPGLTRTGETNGTTLATPVFSASAGDALKFYFNYVTSDGAGFADYAWAELFNSSGNPVALLFTARTEPSGSIVPGTGLPPPNATLTPSSVPIIAGGPAWSPLDGYSGFCFSAGCGYTNWVLSTYNIPSAGNYFLEFGVTNWSDDLYDSGMAIDGVSIGGVPITPGPVPEPSTFLLLGSGLVALAGATRRLYAR